MTTIIAVANHKGGTGKTTTVHTLGVHLSEGGYRVLMLDLDPQGSLTDSCGVQVNGQSLADVLGTTEPGRVPLENIVMSLSPGLGLAPATVTLSATELGLGQRREAFLLRQVLGGLNGDYDVVLIDTPPGRGLLMVNALAAAHGVICPAKLSKQDLGGLRLFLEDTLVRITEGFNPVLVLIGILPAFYNGRTIYHRSNLRALRESGIPVLHPIGQSIRVEEAPAVSETILTYEPENPVAVAYRKLGRQVEKWVNERKKQQAAQ